MNNFYFYFFILIFQFSQSPILLLAQKNYWIYGSKVAPPHPNSSPLENFPSLKLIGLPIRFEGKFSGGLRTLFIRDVLRNSGWLNSLRLRLRNLIVNSYLQTWRIQMSCRHYFENTLVPPGFGPGSIAFSRIPEAMMLDRYTTGLYFI